MPEIYAKFEESKNSVNPQGHDRLIVEIQQYTMNNMIFVAVLRHATLDALGPRIANKPDEIWGSIPQHAPFGPFEDIS